MYFRRRSFHQSFSVVLKKLNLTLEGKGVLANINRVQLPPKGPKMLFLSMVTLTFDIDLHACPSEGRNTSSV